MDDYITAGELALLLAVFWLPVFILAFFPQWHFLVAYRKRVIWLLAALLFEFTLAFSILLSPLPRYFLSLDFLGSLSSGSIPLQAAVLAAAVVTFLVWLVGCRGLRPAP